MLDDQHRIRRRRRRIRRGRAVHGRRRRARRGECAGGGEGRHLRRCDRLVGWLDVDPAQPVRARRRRGGGPVGAADLPGTPPGRELRRREGGRVARRRPGDGGVLREADRGGVRGGREDRRHPWRHAGCRDRAPLGRAQAGGSAHPRSRRRGAAAPPVVRDVVPRHGHHGRRRPAGVPALDPISEGVRALHCSGDEAHARPRHEAARAAVGERHRAGRAVVAVGAGCGRRDPGEDVGDVAADRGRARGRGAAGGTSGRLHGAGAARSGAGDRRVHPRSRPARGDIPAYPDRARTLDADAVHHHGRRDHAGGVGRRAAGPVAGVAGGLLPGVDHALPQRETGCLPAHPGPWQAGRDRGARRRAPLRQRGSRVPRLHDGDGGAGARGPRGVLVAGRRPALPAVVPAGHGQARAGPDVAVPAFGIPGAGQHDPRSGGEDRRRRRQPGEDRRGVQRRRPRRGRTPNTAAAPRRSTVARGMRTIRGPIRRWRRSNAARSTR